VVEFLDGVTMLEYLRALGTGDEMVLHNVESSGFDPNQFARNIVDNFLSDACNHGMFHADLHPANLMILPGNSVGYIDFGITGLLSQYSSHNLVALTLAFTRADLNHLYSAFIKSSALGPNADVEEFRDGLKNFADDWYTIEGNKRRLRKTFTLVMLDMLDLSRKTDVWPERDIIKYIRSAIAIDGLIARFAPDFNLAQYLERVCGRHIKWQMRRALFSYDTFIGVSSAGSRLMSDGALRVATLIDRYARGELVGSADKGAAKQFAGAALRMRAIWLAVAVFIVTLLITVTPASAQLGVNLFTAEIVFITVAMAAILRSMRRLA
jgi:ubiquinone biosynthesis protein